eukprot:2383154-Amphidinium_carterae.2
MLAQLVKLVNGRVLNSVHETSSCRCVFFPNSLSSLWSSKLLVSQGDCEVAFGPTFMEIYGGDLGPIWGLWGAKTEVVIPA